MSVKGLGLGCAIMYSLWVGWCVLMSILGIGDTPFNFFDQVYFGWLTPTVGGLILGMAIAFVDGFVAGAIVAWIHNNIKK